MTTELISSSCIGHKLEKVSFQFHSGHTVIPQDTDPKQLRCHYRRQKSWTMKDTSLSLCKILDPISDLHIYQEPSSVEAMISMSVCMCWAQGNPDIKDPTVTRTP